MLTFDYKGTEILIKYSFRALLTYERLANKAFHPENLFDLTVFFYATIIACNRDLTTSFDEYLDWLDVNPHYITIFTNWLTLEFKKEIIEDKPVEKKTKNKKKKDINQEQN